MLLTSIDSIDDAASTCELCKDASAVLRRFRLLFSAAVAFASFRHFPKIFRTEK